MSLVKYEILNKVAEVKSFTKAADALALTQSAVSHAITNLESEFGFLLVNRNRSGITLTTEGETMLLAIRKVLQENEKVHQEAASLLGLAKGTIKIGIFKSVSTKWLPEIIRLMEKNYPEIQIQLKEGDYLEIEQWLLSGEIDCGFINITHSSQFHIISLKKDRLLCVVSDQSALYHQKTVSFEDLEKEPFIMPTYGGYHDIKQLFEEHGIQPDIRFELMDESAILSMVTHHLGISILPEMLLDSIPQELRAIPFQVDSYRSIGLATRYHLSPAAKKFAETTQAWLQDSDK
ncbi:MULTISPECIES: LysR family transcriptional regulator [Priestia]|jgi:DNA-binding transcriptional LysR family regulator|uniref:Transcriptional regulator, LysR family n=4 Tax=Priestia TaxID=2800373 RepID=D5DZH0_PRIM1|nr:MULTISPECIES: LysR family transcriptional regulator [Priestia]AVX09320.1 LysR family transcriptional regulator [Bacillus sp. Y-01]KOP75453.1 LysR family transcriptional regulator [Bacillus sp. FJAT-21351]KQU16610.1 LysR family transcriptional regulator [Bacillus sp. Leaf75]MCF6797246.1 LysR family transcriptional regulator [Bacillus sp. ET1]MDP9576236.1 DNA-binding transcriptional LysR family regulator [Bacillus sp. 1751]RFB26436.1 LysR family transcriptional regulator [Bacillus sp. ALD]R